MKSRLDHIKTTKKTRGGNMITNYCQKLCVLFCLCFIISCEQLSDSPNLKTEPINTADEDESDFFHNGSTGKLKKAKLYGPGVDGVEVMAQEINGELIFEGDIVVADASQKSIYRSGNRFRWPNGVVPYVIDSNFSNNARNNINAAIRAWEDRVPCLEFVPRGNERDYIRFYRRTDGRSVCSSAVGRVGGRQTISLVPSAGGCTVHEIGHALGLWHEQSREDRDQHVRINFQNIREGSEHNFRKHVNDGTDFGPYDFTSMMHYRPNSFSKNGQPTIVALNGQTIRRANPMSQGDANAVRAIYGCANGGGSGGGGNGGNGGNGGSGGGSSNRNNLNIQSIGTSAYGGQDDSNSGSIRYAASGAQIVLTGNRWRSTNSGFNITSRTVIEFDFGSTSQGEIHGIGFDSDNGLSSDRIFQLYGTQNWGRNGPNYSSPGNWQSFKIRVGQNFTGNNMRLIFVNDKDNGTANNNSYFRNIKIYEE